MCLNPIRKNYYIQDNKFVIDWHSSGSVQAGSVIELSCGQCIECCINRSINWAVRAVLEARTHKDNCFITLTYSKTDGELHKDDFQKFMKRLRKSIYPTQIKYIMCGEYGSKGGRPHYHALIFGWKPKDLTYFFTSGDCPLFQSKTVEKLWGKGFITVGEITFDSALYTSKYLQKFNRIEDKCQKPYNCFSHYLGLSAIQTLNYDVDGFYIRGKKYSVPRYYDKKAIDLGLITKDELREVRKHAYKRDLRGEYDRRIQKIDDFEKNYQYFVDSRLDGLIE